MLFLYRAKLVILSQPKTGTTALQRALGHRASIAVNSPPEMKHVSYRGFMKYHAPVIEAQCGLKRDDYLVVATMRAPRDWLGSWYRYRTRRALQDSDNPRSVNYTGGLTFDQFVSDVCKPDSEQPVYAQVKTPSWIALASHNCIGVDRLYPYEDMTELYELIHSRTGKPVEPARLNVSPEMPLSLSPDIDALLRRSFAFELDLHASLRRDGQVEHRFCQPGPPHRSDGDLSPGV